MASHQSLQRCVTAVAIVAMWQVVMGSTRLAAQPPAIEKFLTEGRLADGAAAMEQVLKAKPDDAPARFSLGITQVLQAVEKLGQDQFRFGLLGGRRRALPFMRLPIAENDTPEQISYAKFRTMIQSFVTGLTTAEATLAKTRPTGVKLPITIGQVRLDLDADGVATDEESFWKILAAMQSGGRVDASAPEVNQFVIAFDDADVLWLRGYCHVMAALGEVLLAYDGKDQFERTAHLFYPDVETPYPYLIAEGTGPMFGFNGQNVLDLIALIHTFSYDVIEPERMKTALAHLEAVISLSRDSWKLINAETDNDHEWLPNPSQTAAMGGMKVSPAMQAQWSAFLDEAEAILQGKKLMPFWRGIEGGFMPTDRSFPSNPDLGINLRKVFTDPTRFDLVLWLQGTGLHPYLEKGEITDPDSWRKIVTAFQGEFFVFMVWFN